MWDCKHRTVKDRCRKRKDVCFPGGKGCVLESKFEFPLQKELKAHQVLSRKKAPVSRKRKLSRH